MVAEFLSFLKENNALRGYQKAVRKQKWNTYFKKTIENIINPFTELNQLEYCSDQNNIANSLTWHSNGLQHQKNMILGKTRP